MSTPYDVGARRVGEMLRDVRWQARCLHHQDTVANWLCMPGECEQCKLLGEERVGEVVLAALRAEFTHGILPNAEPGLAVIERHAKGKA